MIAPPFHENIAMRMPAMPDFSINGLLSSLYYGLAAIRQACFSDCFRQIMNMLTLILCRSCADMTKAFVMQAKAFSSISVFLHRAAQPQQRAEGARKNNRYLSCAMPCSRYDISFILHADRDRI